jgi:hypothetical protein
MAFAIAAPTLLGAAASVGGSLIQRESQSDAIDAQTDASNQANATQRYIFDTQNENLKPYREAGYNALSEIKALLSDPNRITSDPGYQFGLNQGQQAIERSAAARGSLYSGATLKALQRYGQDYGGTKLNESYNRLSNIAGLGQVANQQGAGIGMNYANQVSAHQTGLGNAQGANALAMGNTWADTVNQLGALGGRALAGGGSGGGGSSWGSSGMNNFFYGNGTSGE